LGYEVSTSLDAFQAIETAEKNMDIDVFLVDVVLPGGKSGVDFALSLRELRPDARVLLMSGYPESELLKNEDLEFSFISKPFNKSTISKAIEKALL
jgi:DNA-binding NtrC family response regulator